MNANENLQNMRKLDDSWNAQDLETFRRYHAKDCIVRSSTTACSPHRAM